MMRDEQRPAIDLNRLRGDLAKARERVRDLEQLILLAERWYSDAGQAPSNTGTPSDEPEAPEGNPATDPSAVPAEGPLAALGARDAAVQLLKSTGTAWKVDQATKRMLELGWVTNSPDPESVVRSAMVRDRRLKKVAPGQFRYDEANGSTAEASQPPSGHPAPPADGQLIRTPDGRFGGGGTKF
jgi:hypothetical protein